LLCVIGVISCSLLLKWMSFTFWLAMYTQCYPAHFICVLSYARLPSVLRQRCDVRLFFDCVRLFVIIVSLKVLVLIKLESVDVEFADRRLLMCFTSMAVDVIRMLFVSNACHRFDLLTPCRRLLLGQCNPL